MVSPSISAVRAARTSLWAEHRNPLYERGLRGEAFDGGDEALLRRPWVILGRSELWLRPVWEGQHDPLMLRHHVFPIDHSNLTDFSAQVTKKTSRGAQ